MKVWRLQTNTDSKTGEKITDYCLENNVLAAGWSLIVTGNDKESIEIAQARADINNDFEKYCKVYKRVYRKDKTVNDNIIRLCSVTADDLVWIRDKGIYYLGRVKPGCKWQFVYNSETEMLDAANQVTNVEWHLVGAEASVPGAISTSFIRGRTLQGINKEGALQRSQIIYNEITGSNYYQPDFNNKNFTDVFFNMLSPEDCEDLLCLWLFVTKNYVCIPSTNKRSTALYECVLKNPQNGMEIYPQVKAGTTDIKAKDYVHLKGEVWLFTTFGKVDFSDCADTSNINVADKDTLFEFIQSDTGKNILPSSILTWYNKLKIYFND